MLLLWAEMPQQEALDGKWFFYFSSLGHIWLSFISLPALSETDHFLIYQTWFNPVSHWCKYYQPSAFIIPVWESESLLAESPEYPEWASSGRNWKYSVRKAYGWSNTIKGLCSFTVTTVLTPGELRGGTSSYLLLPSPKMHIHLLPCAHSRVPVPLHLSLENNENLRISTSVKDKDKKCPPALYWQMCCWMLVLKPHQRLCPACHTTKTRGTPHRNFRWSS